MCASVMVHEHDVCNSRSTNKFGEDKEPKSSTDRRQVEEAEDSKEGIMDGEAHLLKMGNIVPGSGLFGLDEEKRLNTPNQLQCHCPWNEVVMLIRYQRRSTRNSLNTTKVIYVPNKEGQIINIRISIQDVSYSMVGIVSFLPPVYGVATAHATTKICEEVVKSSGFKNLLMTIIMTQPSLLLIA